MTRNQRSVTALAASLLYICGSRDSLQSEPLPTFDPQQALERTCFQTAGPYQSKVDIKSDVAIVYGFHGNLDERLKGWRDHGYLVHLMTGVAWGNYQDYFSGKWDGVSHEDEAQTDRNGKPILHDPTVPYVAPSETYGKYLCVGVKRALDAGVAAVHLEEPEFWVRGGYSESFKRQWQSYYNEPWIPPHASPDAQYRASKLKYFLYRRALQQVFDFVRDDNQKNGRQVRCYVPTHSLINYAHWRIVSPEQSLVRLNGCDGYIGQVWTGTARTPNQYQGLLKERTFETAFFEYGVLQNLVRSTGRRMYYLNDPVEDNPGHSWEDYQRNWECTLVASLLWPEVWRYEVAPWPERPFLYQYPAKDKPSRPAGGPEERVSISPAYATELLTVFNALNDMQQSAVEWDCGTQGAGILVSDTLMFQRGEPQPSDPHLGSFYGLALPLLKSGLPVQPVQYENIGSPDYLQPYRILLLTYEGMKPPSAELHTHLARWVKSGGVLIVVDDDADPYNAVKEWWNTGALKYAVPRQHLFEQLGLKPDCAEGLHEAGQGSVIYRRQSPANLAKNPAGAAGVLSLTKDACQAAKLEWSQKNYLLLRRGPYVIAAGMDESPVGEVKAVQGRFINLFDPQLSVSSTIKLQPGARLFLLDLDRCQTTQSKVLASASKVTSFSAERNKVRFYSAGPEGTLAATRLALPGKYDRVTVGDLPASQVNSQWDETSKTVRLEYPNRPGGHWVEIGF